MTDPSSHTENAYESLVEALLRLRQPHLSERLDPTQLGAVLSDSLPPLDAERVRAFLAE